MDFKNIFIVIGISLIGIIGFFGFADDLNTNYGSSLGWDMNTTRSNLQSGFMGNLSSISGDLGNSTLASQGASEGTGTTALITRSLRVIGSLPTLLGLIPSVMRDAAGVIGIPTAIIDVGVWLFIISFAIVLAYLFLIGARSLIS